MAIGLTSKFNILHRSPHDLNEEETIATPPAEREAGTLHWVPSRFNIRARTEDGRLVVWNSYRRSMSVFSAAQRPIIEGMLSKKGFTARAKGMTKYLFERGYLLKEGTDEYRRIQLGFGQQQYRTDTLQLALLASEDCNFRCQYCYEEFTRGTMLPQVRAGIKNLVTRRLENLRILSVSWFGGEPLYGFPAIEELAPFFVEMAAKNSLRYSGSMTTNGFLLTPDIADKLLAWQIDRFQITLDGIPEDHDRSRPARDGGGTFGTILENLRAMHRRPASEEFEIGVRVNWDLRNFPHLSTFMNIIKTEFGSDHRFRLRFHSVFPSGTPNDDQLALCGMDEAVHLQRELEREARKKGLLLADDLRAVQPVSSGMCYAARPYHFVIGATGKVMKCTVELDMADRNVVGYLSESGEMSLDQDKMALWCEPAFESDAKCQKCVVLPVCMGSSCPLIRFDQHKSPCIPLRTTVKRELRDIAELEEGRQCQGGQGEGVSASLPKAIAITPLP
jgi:uncharacterized protein